MFLLMTHGSSAAQRSLEMKMTVLNKTSKMAIASFAAAMLLSPLSAMAAEVIATGGGAMYTGPSLEFKEVGFLTSGDLYDVTVCTATLDWCKVVGNDGIEGWYPGADLVGEAAKIDARDVSLRAGQFWNPEK